MDGANERGERHVDRVNRLDLVKEEIPAERFTHTATPGIYSCRIGTIVVRMPEADRDLVCSGIVSKLLRSRPDALDVETEQIARSHLATDLISLYEESRRTTEHIKSIMLLLGQESYKLPKEMSSTESIAQPPRINLSQEPEHFSDEEYFPVGNERSPHKRSGCLKCDTTKRNPGKRQCLKKPVRPKRGSYLTWSDKERKMLRDMMSRKVFRSWLQVRRDFNRISTKRRSTNSVRG